MTETNFQKQVSIEAAQFNAVRRVTVCSHLGLEVGQWFRLSHQAAGIDDAPAYVMAQRIEPDGSLTDEIDVYYNDDTLPIMNAAAVAMRQAMVALNADGSRRDGQP
jgi:hypothetical protein